MLKKAVRKHFCPSSLKMKIKTTLMSMWNKIEYLSNFKLFDNVYGILDTSYLIYVAFGMTPYWRIRSPKGNLIYYNMDWRKYAISAWYSFLLLLAITITLLKEFESNFGSLNSIVNIYLIAQMVFGIFTLNTFSARATTLLKAYANCYKAEKILKQLGFKLDYRFIHKVTLYGSLSIVFAATMNLTLHLLWRKTILEFIRFSFVYSFPCALSVIPVYHFNYLGILVLKRLKLINDYLAEDFSTLTKKQVEISLWALAKVHSELCNAVNNVLYASAFSMITFYFFTYLQFSALLLEAMNIAHLKLDVETYIWNMIYIATTVGILVLATILKYEAAKSSYMLCELTSAFFDDSIGTRRNTFLLQMLHQKIDFRIYGHFEVHLGRVLSDLQALVNLLMFATQFRT